MPNKLLASLSNNQLFSDYRGGVELEKPLAKMDAPLAAIDSYTGMDIPAKLVDKDVREEFVRNQQEFLANSQKDNIYGTASAIKKFANQTAQDVKNPLSKVGRTVLNYEATVKLDEGETKRTQEGKIDSTDQFIGKQLREATYNVEGGAGTTDDYGTFIPNEYKPTHIAPDKIDTQKIIKSYGEGFKSQVLQDKDGKFIIRASSNPTKDGYIRDYFEKWSGVTGDRVHSYVAANLMFDDKWRPRTEWEGKKAFVAEKTKELGSIEKASEYAVKNPTEVDEYVEDYTKNQAQEQAGLETIKQTQLDIQKKTGLKRDPVATAGYEAKLKKSQRVLRTEGSAISLLGATKDDKGNVVRKITNSKQLATGILAIKQSIVDAQAALIIAQNTGSTIGADNAQAQIDFNNMRLQDYNNLQSQAKEAYGITEPEYKALQDKFPITPENLRPLETELQLLARNSVPVDSSPEAKAYAESVKRGIAKLGEGATEYVEDYKKAYNNLKDVEKQSLKDIDTWLLNKASTASIVPNLISSPDSDINKAIEQNFSSNTNWVIMDNGGVGIEGGSDGELAKRIRTNGKITNITQNKIGNEHYYTVSSLNPDTKETDTYYAKPGSTNNNIKDVWALGIIDNVYEGNTPLGEEERMTQLTIASNMITDRWGAELSMMDSGDTKAFYTKSFTIGGKGVAEADRTIHIKKENGIYTLVDATGKARKHKNDKNIEFSNKNDLDKFLTMRNRRLITQIKHK